MDDFRIMKEKNGSIWDKFASVYSAFVTGTPGNKKAYEAIDKRIRSVVRDKEVLEIATGPGVIAKQVAAEAKSMIATDFSEKMLAVAHRGEVPDNLRFEAKWDAGGFIAFLVENGFEVKNSKELNSTIPMVYVEAVQM